VADILKKPLIKEKHMKFTKTMNYVRKGGRRMEY
jgi:hypothetical protein